MMKLGMIKRGTIFSVSLLALGASSAFAGAKEQPSQQPSRAGEVSVMAYNIENFFDNVKDNATDNTFLPLALKNTPEHRAACAKIPDDFYKDECNSFDWSDQILATKVNRVASVIASIDNGNGPDILILEEVENVRILGRLMAEINKRLPADKAYLEPILLEGWDTRGIDVGMLSRFKRAKPTTITPVIMNGQILNTRGILHSVFELPNGTNLNVFGVHFPSGGNPVANREAAVKALNTELTKLPADEIAIAGGDFNINAGEARLYSDQLGSQWLVSHLIGCKQCEGTEYFGKDQQWSFLDALLFSKNLGDNSKNWSVDVQSIDVPNNGPEQTWQGKPNRFSADHGVSDHWPIFARLRSN